jgi:glutamate synthase domain-containing protein 3
VILGETGKNFGAGMSGGIAYVFDPLSRFDFMCNKEMVLLEPLDEEDQDLVKSLVEQHKELTESQLADKILGNWKYYIDQFIKVIPTDYKAVLESKKTKKEVA